MATASRNLAENGRWGQRPEGKLLLLKIDFSPGWCGSWTECWPENQMVADSIPSQGTCLGSGPGHWIGAHERQPHIDVSPFLPLSVKINKLFLKKIKRF